MLHYHVDKSLDFSTKQLGYISISLFLTALLASQMCQKEIVSIVASLFVPLQEPKKPYPLRTMLDFIEFETTPSLQILPHHMHIWAAHKSVIQVLLSATMRTTFICLDIFVL
jgi:hypothetical protein